VSVPAALILAILGVGAQQAPPPAPRAPAQPPRDVVRRAEPTGPAGTGVIRGRVVSADTGSPIRRAAVTLSQVPPAGGRGRGGTPAALAPGSRGSGPSSQVSAAMSMSIGRPRQATADLQGAFAFTGLPAGSYRIVASSNQYAPQYLSMAYGGRRPSGPGSSDPGRPIQLAEGESFDKAIIALPRGAVITGRVTDENAEPIVRVHVSALFFPQGSSRGLRMGPGSQTDDLGQFRIYGLQPGEHVVVAEAVRSNYVAPDAPPETEEDKIGFVATYYPGTADEGSAQRVRARIGTETPGIEIRLAQSRLYRVSGSAVDSQGRPLLHVNGQLMRRTAAMAGGSSFGFTTDEQGRFQMRNVPSGSYRLIIRQTGPYRPGPQIDPGEMATLPLTIAGADVENVLVMTTPGATIAGQIVFEQGPPAAAPGSIRVIATPGNPDEMSGLQWPQPAIMKPDQTFTMKGLMGELLIRAAGPDVYVKSVTVGNEDITDSVREFKANERVTITLTTRVSTVEGHVTDDAGAAAAEAGILIFSEDKASWRFNSVRTRRAAVDPEGDFRVTGLMPGRYLVAAVPRGRLSVPASDADASFFEELSKEATPIVLGEDEQRRIELKVAAGRQ